MMKKRTSKNDKLIKMIISGLNPCLTVTIFFILIVSGCDSQLQVQEKHLSEIDVTELIESSLTYYEGQPFSKLEGIHEGERLLNELADIFEGFGGVWFDPDDAEHIVIAYTDIKDLDNNQALSNLKTVIINRLSVPDLHTLDYRFSTKKVTHSFRELQYFRDLLHPIIHRREDIVKSYIDIENNMYSIGVLKGTNRFDYNNAIETFSIPETSISIFETGMVLKQTSFSLPFDNEEFVASNCSNKTVQDHYRPLKGGFQIENGNGKCTFGFNIMLDFEPMWVTNSHCTDQMLYTGQTQFYQNIVSSFNLIGTEFRDFAGYFMPNDHFRYSDAALIKKQPNVNSQFGSIISSCEGGNVNWGQNGGMTVGGVNSSMVTDDFQIVNDNMDVLTNMPINKIGRTSGWTRGLVINPCSTISNIEGTPPSFSLKCQIVSDLYANSGDSGSPVFYWSPTAPLGNNNVSLIGILWGRDPIIGRTFHSRTFGIKGDLTVGNEMMITY